VARAKHRGHTRRGWKSGSAIRDAARWSQLGNLRHDTVLGPVGGTLFDTAGVNPRFSGCPRSQERPRGTPPSSEHRGGWAACPKVASSGKAGKRPTRHNGAIRFTQMAGPLQPRVVSPRLGVTTPQNAWWIRATTGTFGTFQEYCQREQFVRDQGDASFKRRQPPTPSAASPTQRSDGPVLGAVDRRGHIDGRSGFFDAGTDRWPGIRKATFRPRSWAASRSMAVTMSTRPSNPGP